MVLATNSMTIIRNLILGLAVAVVISGLLLTESHPEISVQFAIIIGGHI